MNVNFEKIDPVNATLTISFVEEDYKSDVKTFTGGIEHVVVNAVGC